MVEEGVKQSERERERERDHWLRALTCITHSRCGRRVDRPEVGSELGATFVLLKPKAESRLTCPEDGLVAVWPFNRRVWGAVCRLQGVGCMVQGVGCRLQGVGCRMWGVGCRL